MIKKDDFYGQCNKEEGTELTSDVRAAAGDCFKNRRCNEPDGLGTSLDQSEQEFVGFRPDGECRRNCTNDDIGLEQDLRTLASQRYKRDIEGVPINGNQQSTQAIFLIKAMSENSKPIISLEEAHKFSCTNPAQCKGIVNDETKKADSLF